MKTIAFGSIVLQRCACCQDVYYLFVPVDLEEEVDVVAFPIYSREEGFTLLGNMQERFPQGITPPIYQRIGMAIVESDLPEADPLPSRKKRLNETHTGNKKVLEGVYNVSNLLIRDAIKV